MSEAELHVLKARLQGGILNKAKRGELQSSLPVGFVYNAENRPILDPDKQVQESLRAFFGTFARTGSATATVKAFRQQGLLFPRRLKKGPHKGDLLWAELTQPFSAGSAQPPLCRSFHLRSDARSQEGRRRRDLSEATQGPMGLNTRDACPLHRLGTI
jgi:hypothetical protein